MGDRVTPERVMPDQTGPDQTGADQAGADQRAPGRETDKNQELTAEQENLDQTIRLALRVLEEMKAKTAKSRQAIMAAKKEMGEYTAHAIGGLYSDGGFQELVEAGQQVHQINSQIALHDEDAAKIARLERMAASPYFARIDFLFAGENRPEKLYIGRSSLKDPETNEIAVYDWRTPVASVFYRFSPGPAHYDAPAGKIEGQLLLKRQFEIKGGRLEYFFDADVEVVDEFLRRILSQNSSAKMKTIVETIQKDQDAVIRDSENELLMVQGVAGSGKTSIGLHRVAYLMYQDQKKPLQAENIVVLSPNTVFEQYIANVLPELGETNVTSLTMDKILQRLLHLPVQSKNRLLEDLVGSGDNKACGNCSGGGAGAYSSNSNDSNNESGEEGERGLLKASLEFKTSCQFIEIMNRFVQVIPRYFVDFQDVVYAGKTIADRQTLKSRVINSKKSLPLAALLKQLEPALLAQVHSLRKSRLNKLNRFIKEKTVNPFEIPERARLLSIRESTVLIKEIRRFTEVDCRSLYSRLFEKEELFYRLAKGLALPENIGEILRQTRENLKDEVLRHEDGLALAYLTLAIKGYHGGRLVRQVVVDEAQDYYPLHFELFKRLFPQAHYTVLGDVNQTVGKEADLSLYEEIRRILDKKSSSLAVMNKSFRCTREILNYSSRFLEDACQIESFSRQGEEPLSYRLPGRQALAAGMMEEIAACRQKGYRSIGLICKTAKEAAGWYACLQEQGGAAAVSAGAKAAGQEAQEARETKLSGQELQIIRRELKLIGEDRAEEPEGIFLIPIYMAKGLEFDAVLILDADGRHYRGQEDRKLLYIACTRALHRLSLFCDAGEEAVKDGKGLSH